MDDGFELLEQKVQKAVELVESLQRKNKALQADLAKAKTALRSADKKLSEEVKAREGSESQAKELDALRSELGALRREREEVRMRIAKLVEILDNLD
jgi:uncharacterized coiled-coil DUF342 family protein